MRASLGQLNRRQLLQSSGIAAGAGLTGISSALVQGATPPATPANGTRPRARDLGVPFLGGDSGPFNAITDVSGVGVSHVTLIEGDGPLEVGVGPIRAGLTAIVPRMDEPLMPCFAGRHTLNGNGEMTGGQWVDESGFLNGPVMLTGTYSVGVVKDAISDVAFNLFGIEFGLPVVAETYDGLLNDAHGHHITAEHVAIAFSSAAGGPVAEGSVGGGTAMTCFDFKGGIGTASRVIPFPDDVVYTVGVLVQANHGFRETLTVAGVPVGLEIQDLAPELQRSSRGPLAKTNSIVVVIATDAPFLPHQLKRLAQRAGLGIALGGGRGEDASGDLFIAFSTAPVEETGDPVPATVAMLPNFATTPFFHQVAAATDEAIINAMVAADTMVGINGNTVYGLPHDRLRAALKKYNRLSS